MSQRYEGQVNHIWHSLPPSWSVLPYALTTFIIAPLRNDGQVKLTEACALAHHSIYLCVLSSPGELTPARLVIHRQTSRHARRMGTLGRAVEVRHWRFSSPCSHYLRITVELSITGARHEEADA